MQRMDIIIISVDFLAAQTLTLTITTTILMITTPVVIKGIIVPIPAGTPDMVQVMEEAVITEWGGFTRFWAGFSFSSLFRRIHVSLYQKIRLYYPAYFSFLIVISVKMRMPSRNALVLFIYRHRLFEVYFYSQWEKISGAYIPSLMARESTFCAIGVATLLPAPLFSTTTAIASGY